MITEKGTSNCVGSLINKVRAKAIKEFADKLKAISQPYVDGYLLVLEFQINDLVREMVGDTEYDSK